MKNGLTDAAEQSACSRPERAGGKVRWRNPKFVCARPFRLLKRGVSVIHSVSAEHPKKNE